MEIPVSPLFRVLVDDPEAETSVSGSESTDSYTEVSADSDLLSAVERTNDLLTGIIFFLGLIFGIIGMLIFWERFKKY